jgi:hypothetical protein
LCAKDARCRALRSVCISSVLSPDAGRLADVRRQMAINIGARKWMA